MAEPPTSPRPAFDLGRVGASDKILAGGAAILFIDCFLTWQRFECIASAPRSQECLSANAWQGSATVAGVLMGFLAFLLAVAVVADALGFGLPVPVRLATVVQVLAWVTVAAGMVKFLVVAAHHPRLGAWIGLAALVMIAYGAWMKYQEGQAGQADGFFDQPGSPAG